MTTPILLGGLVALALLLVGARQLRRWLLKQQRRKAVRQLIQDCEGDQDLAERLMWQEMRDAPSMSFTQAARLASARLRKDRR